MDLGGSYRLGPDEALVIEGLLGDDGHRPADTNAVTAHSDADGLALLPQHVQPKCICILTAQLEDVANFDGPVQCQGRPASGTWIALGHRGHLYVTVHTEVATHHGIHHVVFELVGPRGPCRTGCDTGIGKHADPVGLHTYG